MNFSYLTTLPDILGTGILVITGAEKQDQPTPKLQPLVRAGMKTGAVINPKYKQIRRDWRRGAIIFDCTMRVAPAHGQ
jgi:hypothetical protein